MLYSKWVRRLFSPRHAVIRKPARNRTRLKVETFEDRVVPASLVTDFADYAPGSTAYITGTGFAIGETIDLEVTLEDGTVQGAPDNPWSVTDGGAGDLDGIADGNFTTTWYVEATFATGQTLIATATGETSGDTASWTFTDGNLNATNSTASAQNGNGYASQLDVYLVLDNVPSGSYTITVESPSGTLLGTSNGLVQLNKFDGSAATIYHLWDLVSQPDSSQGYAPTDNDGGEYKVTIDNGLEKGFKVSHSDNFKVTPPLDVLVANPDNYDCVEAGTTLSENVKANDSITSASGDAVSVILVDGPTHDGGFVLNPDGTFSYDTSWAVSAPTGTHPGDSFTYKLVDASGDKSNIATVAIEINRAPVAAADTAATLMNVDTLTGNVLTNDSDPDGDALTVTPVSQTGAYGTVTISADGTYTLTGADSNFTGTVTVPYTITDGCVTSDATLTITVTSNAKTQGYWSTHAAAISQLLTANGLTTLNIAGAGYTATELAALMKLSCGTGSSANALLIEFQQLAAAKLNTLTNSTVVSGVTIGGVTASTATATAIAAAEATVTAAKVANVGSSTKLVLDIKKNVVKWGSTSGVVAQIYVSTELGQSMTGYTVTLTAFNQTGA